MKKTAALILSLVITVAASLTGCGYKYKELNLRAKFDQSLKGTNWLYTTGANIFPTARTTLWM